MKRFQVLLFVREDGYKHQGMVNLKIQLFFHRECHRWSLLPFGLQAIDDMLFIRVSCSKSVAYKQ
jgi:hypothetical protein